MIYVMFIVVGVCALGALMVAFGRAPKRDDVERFHRARQMTTEWSRTYAEGHPGVQAPPVDDRQPETADQR